MSTGTFRSFVASLKKSLWSLILYNFFVILYVYISPGQGQTSPRGQSFDVNRNVLSLHSVVASFKKISLSLLLYNFYMIKYMFIALGQGQTAPKGQNIDVNRKALSLYPFVASFKEISLKSDFIHFFFMIWYMHIAPGQGASFWCQQKLLVTLIICC